MEKIFQGDASTLAQDDIEKANEALHAICFTLGKNYPGHALAGATALKFVERNILAVRQAAKYLTCEDLKALPPPSELVTLLNEMKSLLQGWLPRE